MMGGMLRVLCDMRYMKKVLCYKVLGNSVV